MKILRIFNIRTTSLHVIAEVEFRTWYGFKTVREIFYDKHKPYFCKYIDNNGIVYGKSDSIICKCTEYLENVNNISKNLLKINQNAESEQ